MSHTRASFYYACNRAKIKIKGADKILPEIEIRPGLSVEVQIEQGFVQIAERYNGKRKLWRIPVPKRKWREIVHTLREFFQEREKLDVYHKMVDKFNKEHRKQREGMSVFVRSPFPHSFGIEINLRGKLISQEQADRLHAFWQELQAQPSEV